MSDGSSLTEKFGTSPPFFVRKVDRKGHWGDATRIIEHVFPVDNDGTISVYLVATAEELTRIAVALNANRVATNPRGASLREPVFFVAIRKDEFGEIELQQIDGLTDCTFAKKKHYGALVPRGTEDKRKRLVNLLLNEGRQPSKLTKSVVGQAVNQAEADGCYAVVPDSNGCVYC